MAFVFDPETNKITMSAGDTKDIGVNVAGKDYDAAVFGVYDPKTGDDVVKIPGEIADGRCEIRLATRHTRDVPAGKYKWNVRLVTNPEYDDEGNIILQDDSDNADSIFGPENENIPDFVIRRTGANV